MRARAQASKSWKGPKGILITPSKLTKEDLGWKKKKRKEIAYLLTHLLTYFFIVFSGC